MFRATNLIEELEIRLSNYRQLIENFNSENQGSKARCLKFIYF